MTLIIPRLKLPSAVDEGKRLEELRRLHLLDPTSDGRFDRYTELATKALNTPMAAIVLVDKDVLRFKSVRGLPPKNAPKHISFARHVISAGDSLVISDATRDSRFSNHPIVTGDPHVRFYAGAAVRSESGQPLGAFCVADREPREFSAEERSLLLQFARLLEEDIRSQAALEEFNDQASQYALLDPNSGLPNETLFLRRLNELMSLQRGKLVALAVVRFNGFDQLHKAVGKIGSNYVVSQAVTRLREILGSESLFGHPREDLVAVAFSLRDAKFVNSAIEKVVTSFREPFVLGEHRFPTRVGVGVALWPDDASDEAALLKRARTALDSDSKSITSSYRFYNHELSARAVRRFQIESALGGAIARDELKVVYQPKFGCSERKVKGVEALLRWTNEDLGCVSPAEFIPIAEESGLITELGAWILSTACEQLASWIQAGHACPEVSVNVAGDQLTSPGFKDQVRKVLDQTSLEGHRLNLEITEWSLIGNMEQALQAMRELRDLGVGFSIDDFGKGFSSLSYLRQMPVQALKIDQKFVERVPQHQGDAMLLKSIISMGHALGLQVVAEGVENHAQCEFLCAEGCDQIQGFLFGKPMPAHELVSHVLAKI